MLGETGLEDGRTGTGMEDLGRTCTVACGVGPQAVVRARRARFNRVRGVKAQVVHVYNSKTKKLEKFSCEI